MLSLSSQIESILFIRTEGVTFGYIAKLLEVSKDEVEQAVMLLKEELSPRGIQVLLSGETVMLVTHSQMSEKLSSLFEEETGGELSPASLQTLSIILYRKVASRSEISYIRGVDARMSIRNLLLRGLIEKTGGDSYRATTDCLRFLGVTSVTELPRFNDIYDSLSTEVSKRKGE